jgi:hypothetical protein
MADDDKRPFRAKEPYGRPAAGASGNDRHADLARLIGQPEPWSEYGDRAGTRAPQPPAQSAPQAPSFAARDSRPAGQQSYGANPLGSHFSQPSLPYGAPPSAPGSDIYHSGFENPAGERSPPGSYDATAYYQDSAAGGTEDIYDDEPPPRRRISVVAIGGVFALAVLGTAGAFGYRALFGSTGSTPPPVIKADASPSKIVPSSNGEPQSSKITDRMGDRGRGEKLVSREEQPIDLKDRPPQSVFPGAPNSNASPPPAAPANTGIVGEPKKIRTIAIRPDQPFGSTAAAAATVPSSSPPPAPAKPAAARAAAPAVTAEAEEAKPPVRQIPIRQTPPQSAQSANAPLSLNPESEGAPARAPARTASAPPRAPAPAATVSAGGPGSYVQVSSQRSEADAQSSFRALQGKFPSQLGSRQAVVRRADLGDKGTYYRAMVGPFASASEASELCSSLKSAGGQCIVQRN